MLEIDGALHVKLRDGDEQAFLAFVSAHHAGLRRFARIDSRGASADALVCAAWSDFLVTLRGPCAGELGLRAVAYRALAQRMRLRSHAAGRPDPFAPLAIAAPAVPAQRFLDDAHRWGGGWALPPKAFPKSEHALAAPELSALLERALAELPSAIEAVAVLRDVARLSADEVCNVLALTAVPYRAMLHAARSHLRAVLERHYDQQGAS